MAINSNIKALAMIMLIISLSGCGKVVQTASMIDQMVKAVKGSSSTQGVAITDVTPRSNSIRDIKIQSDVAQTVAPTMAVTGLIGMGIDAISGKKEPEAPPPSLADVKDALAVAKEQAKREFVEKELPKYMDNLRKDNGQCLEKLSDDQIKDVFEKVYGAKDYIEKEQLIAVNNGQPIPCPNLKTSVVAANIAVSAENTPKTDTQNDNKKTEASKEASN